MRGKRRNFGVEGQESADSISRLPDGILAHILSFMPTKDSVATSVFSSKWEFLWKYTRNLHFVHNGDGLPRQSDRDNETYMKFANFVTRVLLLHDLRELDNFCIELLDENMVYDSVAMDNINNWIDTAVARNIKSFQLCGRSILRRFQLPSCVFTCDTLEKLDLTNIVMLSPSSMVLLPNVKILRLDNVCFENDESVCRLLSGCSSLHTLYVDRLGDDNVVTFTVRSLTLKHLTILSTRAYEYHNYSKLEINAPALKYLYIDDHLFAEFSVESFPSLVEASICLNPLKEERFDDHWSCFDNLIAALYNVKVLTLDPAFWLFVKHSGFPRFGRLTMLTLEQCRGYHLLFELLYSCNTLETLILKRNFYAQSWKKPKRVPLWVRSSLKVMSIDDGFCGREDEVALVDYILQNAGVLSTMSIKVSSQMNVSKALILCQKILNSERKSKNCKIEFS